MMNRIRPVIFAAVVAAIVPFSAFGAGLLVRAANTTLTNIPANPPAFGFLAVNAFGTLTFNNPVAMAVPPGETNRLFVVE